MIIARTNPEIMVPGMLFNGFMVCKSSIVRYKILLLFSNRAPCNFCVWTKKVKNNSDNLIMQAGKRGKGI